MSFADVVRVVRAPESQKAVLARLLEFNSYEFSRFDSAAIHEDGTFGYPYLNAYWPSQTRVPYLIWVGSELAGFALTSQDGDELKVSEFLILPKFRRRGVGVEAARQVFADRKGNWSISQWAENLQATQFWRRAIPVPYAESRESDGSIVQRFNNEGMTGVAVARTAPQAQK